MKITKASATKPSVTSWITVNNVTGTGTTLVNSDGMILDMTTLPEYYDFYIEVRATLQRVGGTGNAKATAVIAGYGESLLTTSNTGAGLKYTTVQEAAATARDRKWIIKPNVLQGIGTTLSERMTVYMSCNGSAADTQFSVSNIQFRLIYFPF